MINDNPSISKQRILKDILGYKISDNRNIVELLEYEGISYWWYIDFSIYNNIDNLDSRLEKRVDINIAKKLFWNAPLLVYSFAGAVYVIVSNAVRHIFGLSRENIGGVDILYYIINSEWRQDIVGELKNIYHSDIIENLLKTNKVTALYDPGFFGALSPKIIRAIYSDKKVPRLPTYVNSSFISLTDFIKEHRARKHFSAIWKLIENDEKWFSLWEEFSGLSVPVMKSIIEDNICYNAPLAVSLINNRNKIISKLNPSIIVMRNEQMIEGRSLVHVARKYNIPTVGIQHGLINNHPAYFNHDSNDVLIANHNDCHSFPIPDVTSVWGNMEYDILTKDAGYPKDQVVVTGNPRYDYLQFSSKNYNRMDFCRRYGINPASFIILWVTQSHGWSDEENHLYFKEVFETFSELGEFTLVIKQHPGESERYRNFIDEYLGKYQMKCSVIVPDKMENTTEMVFCSDIIINKNSTTGHEAIVFHKTMIIMDFSDMPDSGEFVLEGVGLPVYHPGDLLPAICSIINNNIDLREKQELYIRNHMYKIDGCSAKRVANVISECMEHRDN